MRPFTAFVGGSYTSQSRIADQERLVNRYVELMESPGASAPSALYPIPGVVSFATPVAVGCRATFTDDATGRSFAVMGASLTELNSDGTTTDRGAVAVNANPATISTNGTQGGQLLITSGGNAYSYDLASNTLALQLTGTATMGAVLYGYGLVFDKATGTVYLSDLFDLTTWDPTQYFNRTIGADPWQAMHVTPYGYIVLPGTLTGESWYNNGAFPIPFAPDPSGQFAIGIAATFSIQQLGDTVCWLTRSVSGDMTVVRQSGFTPQRISTHPVEQAIANYARDSRIDDAIGQVYGDRGHLFYLLTFPTAGATWAYDSAVAGKANPWAERGTWISENGAYTFWRPVFHTFGFGYHLMGDPQTNTIYRLSYDTSTDVDGRVIRWLRRSPAVIAGLERFIIDVLQLFMETGVGTATGQGADPVVTMRVSRDGGATWGNDHTAHIGKMGEYWRRVIFRSLGLSRNTVVEVVGSDPVPYRISGAFMDVRVCDRQRQVA